MATHGNEDRISARLRRGIVLRVEEDACEIFAQGQHYSARFATPFPSPRTERVAPGHLVALASAADDTERVVWRWFDALILGEEGDLLRVWEPAHGEVAAQSRRPNQPRRPGTRAYLSAGLPGAEWWVAGAAADRAEDADVELEEVERFCTAHDLWNHLE